MQDTSTGKVLADPNGMTLYTYDKDAAGKSNCSGVSRRRVLAAGEGLGQRNKPVGDMTIITRDDGTMQWADGGKPLYTFVQDKQPGDVKGDNFKGVLARGQGIAAPERGAAGRSWTGRRHARPDGVTPTGRHQARATHSISISKSNGQGATGTKVRAGGASLKKRA